MRVVSGASLRSGLALTLAVVAAPTDHARAGGIEFVDKAPAEAHVVVDVRAVPECLAATLAGARCLPAADLFGPWRRLPNISGLLWLLGTAGLDGSEHVLVVGHDDLDREALACLLYLAGQRRVSVLARPVGAVLAAGATTSKGIARSITREVVYQGPMRADLIVLRHELAELIASELPPIVLDGRKEAEYWGETVRAGRGGHVPGAQSSPLDEWPAAPGASAPISLPAAPRAIVYAHQSYDSLAMMARVTAAGMAARVYIDGWVGWAADGALPADAVTYPTIGAARAGSVAATRAGLAASRPLLLLIVGALALLVIGYAAGRMNPRRSRSP